MTKTIEFGVNKAFSFNLQLNENALLNIYKGT